jgi:hypothetical protein
MLHTIFNYSGWTSVESYDRHLWFFGYVELPDSMLRGICEPYMSSYYAEADAGEQALLKSLLMKYDMGFRPDA